MPFYLKITMDTYGHLMSETDNEAAEQIADLLFGSKMVATGSKEEGLADVSYCFKGGQGRNRTTDTRIFSPLLYRLSYLAITGKRAL
jgi:hypothetical protein